VGIVASGGNIDVGLLARLMEKGLTEEGRQLHVKVVIGDSPGQLSRLLALIADRQVNVLTVQHERWHPGISPNQVEVRLILETRNARHARDVVEDLRKTYPNAEVLA
jgi:threonine dehydratase